MPYRHFRLKRLDVFRFAVTIAFLGTVNLLSSFPSSGTLIYGLW